MKIKVIKVLVSRKVTDSNYGHVHAEVGAEAEMEDGDDPKQCRIQLRNGLLAELEKTLEKVEEKIPTPEKR